MSNYTTENLIPASNQEHNVPAIRIGDQVFTMAAGGVDVSDTTATTADVLSGKYFYAADGTKKIGTIPTVTATRNSNVVTFQAGYIAAAQTMIVGTAVAAQTITPTTSNRTVAAGSYLIGATTIKGDANLTAANIAEGVTIFGVTGTHKGATDFYKCVTRETTNPFYRVSGAGTSDCNGDYYDNGQTIDNHPVFQYTSPDTGTVYTLEYNSGFGYEIRSYPGGSLTILYRQRGSGYDTSTPASAPWNPDIGTKPIPTVTEQIPAGGAGWTGYKAIQNSQTGVWTFEQSVTTGLTYTAFTPEVGKVYDEHATIEATLYTGA